MTVETIVLMAGSNIHGRMIVQAMVESGMRPLVINETGSERAINLAQWLVNEIDMPPPLETLGVEVVQVSAYDSPETMALLGETRPSFLINGGCGILRQPLLEAAVPLNAHPGVLPDFRGLDPVLWSVFKRQPVGATVHVMNTGIDEGPILLTHPMPWRGATSLLQLRLQCMRWGSALLVRYLMNPHTIEPQPQDLSAGAYYGRFPTEYIAVAEANLRGYRAGEEGNCWMQ